MFFFTVSAFSYGLTGSFEKDTIYTTYQTFYEDIVYKAIDSGQLKLDIYTPPKKGKFPALIMIHGGGWRSGNKNIERPLARRITFNGYVTIPVEYRLSLEIPQIKNYFF